MPANDFLTVRPAECPGDPIGQKLADVWAKMCQDIIDANEPRLREEMESFKALGYTSKEIGVLFIEGDDIIVKLSDAIYKSMPSIAGVEVILNRKKEGE
jgi:hypothetical protein